MLNGVHSQSTRLRRKYIPLQLFIQEHIEGRPRWGIGAMEPLVLLLYPDFCLHYLWRTRRANAGSDG